MGSGAKARDCLPACDDQFLYLWLPCRTFSSPSLGHDYKELEFPLENSLQ